MQKWQKYFFVPLLLVLKNIHYLDQLIVSRNKGREGIGLGRDLFSEMPTETCVGVYSYYPGLVTLKLLPTIIPVVAE